MRLERLLLAHDMQQDAEQKRAQRTSDHQAAEKWELWRSAATDRAAHRCRGCGAWLYSVRPCSTPGCC